MEKFTGISKDVLIELKLEFSAFLEANPNLHLNLTEDQLRTFNGMKGSRFENYIGSPTYNKYKYRLFDNLCDSYIRLRLFRYLYGDKNLEEKDPRISTLKFKFGNMIDNISTPAWIKEYRQLRMDNMAISLAQEFGLLSEDKKEYSYEEISNFLAVFAKDYSLQIKLPIDMTKQEYYLQKREKLVRKIDKCTFTGRVDQMEGLEQ